VAQALQEADPAGRIVIVGRRGGVAESLVTEAGLDLETIDIRGLDMRNPVSVARAAWRIPASTAAADRILRRTHADVVVGTGGYVCVPVVAAAVARGIPVVLLEQNAVPGRATRLLARRAKVVATSFEETAVHLHRARVVMTGNPVRREVRELVPALRAERCNRLLVMGGSQGARTLNRALIGCLHDMLAEHEDLHVTHQCGTLDVDEVRSVAGSLPSPLADRYIFAAFFANMPERIANSDLVLMRAGGSSLAECSALGKAMILVPYPHAGGHQLHNVLPYVSAGAAVHVPDSDCTPRRVRREVEGIKQDVARWCAMSSVSESMGRPDAARDVVRLVQAAAQARRGKSA